MKNRYAVSPNEVKQMDTASLRQHFLIDNLFETNQVSFTLSHFDRFTVGRVMPIGKKIALPNPENLKLNYFLERRELGIINVGGKGLITADGIQFELDYKESLYL